jgi:ribosome-associated protein
MSRLHNPATPKITAEDYDGPSKTQLKNQMLHLQELGERLTGLSKDTLKTFHLPEKLLEAILECKRLSAHGAVSRQHQYIGKLMREVDPQPIENRFAELDGQSSQYNGWLHRLERWRDQLIEQDEQLAKLVAEYPDIDIQAIRTQIRNARKEKAEQKPPKAYRELFQTLKSLIPEPTAPLLQQQTLQKQAEDQDEQG